MDKPTLVILAAGMGSRFGGIKQMTPVGPSGEILMDYSVFDALRAGFGKAVFVIRRDFEEDFRQQVGIRYEKRVDVAYAFQSLDDLPPGCTIPEGRVKPWGTAHATRAAREAVGDAPFAVINADDFYGRDAFSRIGSFLASDPSPAEYAMAGFRLRETLSDSGTVSRGVCEVSPNGFLAGLREVVRLARTADGSAVENLENPDAPERLSGDEFVSMNLWGFPAAFLDRIEERFPGWMHKHSGDPKAEWYLPSVVAELVAEGRATVRVLPTTSSWFGVTYPDDRPRVASALARLVEQGVYPRDLFGR